MLHSSDSQALMPAAITSQLKCRGCGVGLKVADGDDEQLGACSFCQQRPQDLKRRPVMVSAPPPAPPPAPQARHRAVQAPPITQFVPSRPTPAAEPAQARVFTQVDVILITKMHRLLPHRELLNILNERRVGPELHTLEALTSKIAELGSGPTRGGGSWAGTRQLLAEARRNGTLAKVTEQTIDDFAVVYSLNARQVMTLKDNVLPAAEEERAGSGE